jgi:hypothetical protein
LLVCRMRLAHFKAHARTKGPELVSQLHSQLPAAGSHHALSHMPCPLLPDS